MSKQSELGEKQLQTLLIENIEYWAEGEDAGEIEHKIIFSYGAAVSAILDWHNNQIEAVLDRLVSGENYWHAEDDVDLVPLSAIEAERNKLKENTDE